MRWIPLVVLVVACEGPPGPTGGNGTDGVNGSPGSQGDPGERGSAGDPTDPAPWLVGDGVRVAITDLTVDASHATITFAITDAAGVPVDRAGRSNRPLTEAPAALAFVLGQLAELPDGTPAQYTAYTLAGGEPATETTGTFTTIDVTAGTYRYTFAAPLAGFDASKTQTAIAVATRGAAASSIDRQVASIRPDGSRAVVAREEVTAGTCNGCHGKLAVHAGQFTEPSQCVVCHQPQHLDLRSLIHQIHRGETLPSVVAGAPLVIDGHDYSTVAFPGFTTDAAQNIMRCETCHAGAQGDRFATKPNPTACVSCHDTTAFVQPVPLGMVLHGGGPQPPDAPCAVCHPANGGLAGIHDEHDTNLLAPTALHVTAELQAIANTAPGQIPTLTFRVLVNGAPRNLLAQPLSSLSATIAGPTTDFATFWQAKIQGSGATGTLVAVDAPAGVFAYTLPPAAAIPQAATGSYQVGVEGNIAVGSVRFGVAATPLAFAVTDVAPVARRTIVTTAQCNGCHVDLAFHGGSRKGADYCVMCHNPGTADVPGAPRFEGTTVTAPALDFRALIHQIHSARSVAFGGFPLPTVANPGGTATSFAEVRYPRALVDCAACHAGTTFTLPMDRSPAYLPTTSVQLACSEPAGNDADGFCTDPFWTIASTTATPPATSVCTSCHDQPYVVAHAQTNTSLGGVEACTTCHGPGAEFDVQAVHGVP